MAGNLRRWVRQLDRIASFPTSRSGFAKISMMPWCTFIAFDIIGDLAFGAPFGMLDKGRDECEAQLEPHGMCESSLDGPEESEQDDASHMKIYADILVLVGPIVLAPGAETLNRRGEVSSTLGLMLSLKPWAKWLPDPFFTNGLKSARNLHGIATVAVSKRRDSTEHATDKGNKQRHDILDMLVNAKDSKGNPMPRDELISEALTQLIAGSDTVSNTACATFYWILHGERAAPGSIVPRLQAELDAAIPANSDIASHAEVKNLPFLRRCVDEAMRLHSTTAIGLPRIVTPASGVQYQGDVFPRGTVLSVPSYTIHRDAEVWGPDVEDFKPDRWLPENLTARQKICFNPFSFGPRACVGQVSTSFQVSRHREMAGPSTLCYPFNGSAGDVTLSSCDCNPTKSQT